jgi:hypothetical protein
MRHRSGWQSLVEWALAFAAVRNRSWPESVVGGLTGVGGVCLHVAYGNRNYIPCPSAGVTIRFGPGELGSSERFTCGGFDPVLWLTVGSILVAAGIVGYWVFRRTHRAADEELVITP